MPPDRSLAAPALLVAPAPPAFEALSSLAFSFQNANHCLLSGTGGFPSAVGAASSEVVSSELVEVVKVPLRDTIVFDYELQEALVGKRSMASTFTESEHIDLLFLMDGPVERLVDFHPPFGLLLLLDHIFQVEGVPTNVVTRRLIDRVPSSAAVQKDDALVGDVL